MEYTLHPYQAAAAERITKWIRQERFEDDDVVISLSAPTGAGKTIISADVIERLLVGDENGPGDEGFTILWMSLSPTLNEQTYDKFVLASSELGQRSHIIDASNEFVKPSLDPGHLYFLNPHKLAPASSQYRASNSRDIDLWDTLTGTVKRAGRRLVVFIDEAHRGTGTAASGEKKNATLMNQFINGTGLGKVKVPLIVGISATPERFEKQFADRPSKKSHVVDVDDVRASGLVKDKLLIAHPNEDIAADLTLLGEAARHRAQMERMWAKYSEETGDPVVHPILVLQMPADPTELQKESWVREILQSDSLVNASQVVHALGDQTSHAFGQYQLEYVDPARIQKSENVRVVLFMDALTTGWDCPRAEVLVSLRGTADETVITQLVGRAVRTPLAKRVVGDEELNSVRVYLPHFDATSVGRVVKQLNSGDDVVPVEVIVDPVRVELNEKVPAAAFRAFEALPTWTRPAKTARSAVDRLMRCAQEVMLQYEVAENPIATAESRIRSAVRDHYEANRKFVEEKLDQYAEVDFDIREFALFSGAEVKVLQDSRQIVGGNIMDLFRQAQGKLPGHTADLAFKFFAKLPEFEEDTAEARLAVAALAAHPQTVTVVENAARGLLEAWRQEHLGTLSSVNPAAAEVFIQIISESKNSEEVPIRPLEPCSVPWQETQWDRHLLAAPRDQEVEAGKVVGKGFFPAAAKTSWERRTITHELASPQTVGWYRNPTGGPSAIGIPWGKPGEQRMLYPDLLFFRQENEEVTASIIDPHAPNQADTVEKWRALGRYAAENAEKLARVYAVIDQPGTDDLWFIDLKLEPVRTALDAAAHSGGNEAEVRKVFAQYGAKYC